MSRPELQTPPELFYNDKMSRKYNSNSRMVGIQAEISNRCIELLNIPVSAMATCLLLVRKGYSRRAEGLGVEVEE